MQSLPDMYVLTKVSTKDNANITEVCGLTPSPMTAQVWALNENHYSTLTPVDGPIKEEGYPAMRY